MQKVLKMWTRDSDLRCEAEGWYCEDGDSFSKSRSEIYRPSLFSQQNIGMVPGVDFHYTYGAPLLALSDGWKLLGVPEKDVNGYCWWFVKD